VGVLIAVTTALILVNSELANADAIGGTPVGSLQYNFQGATIQIPTGSFLTHRIVVSDRQVTDALAGVDGVGPLTGQNVRGSATTSEAVLSSRGRGRIPVR
jgi:hypothetical protein